MANSVQMYYGDYELSPVPGVSLSKSFIKSGAGKSLGVTYSMTLAGTITEMDESAGLKALLLKKESLREAFDCDGKYFRILCNEEVILECYPRINDLQFTESDNNWVFTIPYTISLEFENIPADNNMTGIGEDTKLHPAYISSFSESWNIQFDEGISGGCDSTYGVRVSHNLSAAGKTHYSKPSGSPGIDDGVLEKEAWEQARDYIVDGDYLGFDSNIFNASGVLNFTNGNNWTPYDHFRVVDVSEAEGSYGVQESWLVLNDSGALATEDYTVQVTRSIDQAYDSVSVQGLIRGLEDRVYGDNPGDFSVTTSRYTNAQAYFNTIGPQIRARAVAAYNDSIGSATISNSVGHACNAGTISYTYTYDNRPDSCISGAISSTIQIEESQPTEVFSRIQIPGRAAGPIIQDFNTVNEAQKTLSIEARFPPTSCSAGNPAAPADVGDSIVTGAESAFEANYSKVVKTNDRARWAPERGVFSRNVTWIGTQCP